VRLVGAIPTKTGNVADREHGFHRKVRHRAVSECVVGYAVNSRRLMEFSVLETWSRLAGVDDPTRGKVRHRAAIPEDTDS
jgi:hypothetical protein